MKYNIPFNEVGQQLIDKHNMGKLYETVTVA